MSAPSQKNSVMGHDIRRPRPTLWGWARLFQYVLLPFMGAMLLLDVIFYLIFRYGFDACYGILCLID